MNILLLDDEGEKLRYISNFLKKLGHECEQTNDIKSMKNKVATKKFDVVIIDLVVPIADEEEYIQNQNGFIAIEYLKTTTDTIFYPKRILTISRYLDKEVVWRLNSLGVNGIKYDMPDGEWKQYLKEELDYISMISIKKADVVILTAVENEKTQLNSIFEWKKLDIFKDPLQYYYCEIDNNIPLTIVHCFISKMGVVPSTQATARVIELFEPDCIIMCGIAGGRKGKTNFGDIVIAETALNFASGSIEQPDAETIEFLPDSESIVTNPLWIKPFKDYKENIDLLRKIRDASDPNTEYKCDITLHIGQMATGPAVIKSESFSNNYIKKHSRSYIAIDMETYGVYYTARNLGCKFISIKAISDNADANKNDKYQKYAALLAANMTKYFIMNNYGKM